MNIVPNGMIMATVKGQKFIQILATNILGAIPYTISKYMYFSLKKTLLENIYVLDIQHQKLYYHPLVSLSTEEQLVLSTQRK